MGVPIGTTAPGGSGDMFLMVKGEKFGLIKGEAQDDAHGGEIDILAWSWGIEAHPGIGGGPVKRATVRDLRVTKRVDRASVPLLQACRQNETVKAVLTLRKAGKTPLEFLKITLDQARVIEVALDVDGEGPSFVEKVRLSFNKVEVQYTPQGPDGQALGGLVFQDEFTPGT